MYKKLKVEGKPFCWTDIRRISGVKKKNFQEVVPYLLKYADDDTVSKIMKLIIVDNDEITVCSIFK